jgi:TrmH RNA methyltransferase
VALKDEVKICGQNAVRALIERRPDDVVRVYLTEDRIKAWSRLLKDLAERRKVYHVITEAELEKVAETVHHEGICVVARPKRWLPEREVEAVLEPRDEPISVVALEGVNNPHNLGAIIRVAAHFGVRLLVLLPGGGAVPNLSTAVHRTSEGGVEAIEVMRAQDALRVIGTLKRAGLEIYATSSHGQARLYDQRLARRAAFLFGAEGTGLSPKLEKAADRVLAIPGSGEVESLNVATAAAVVLGEAFRTRGASGSGR